MSYYEDDDGDGYLSSDQAAELGWLDPETVDEIRALLKEVHWETRPGNRSDAALVLIDNILNPPSASVVVDDPTVVWAKILLKDVVG